MPREGHDVPSLQRRLPRRRISIHVPREGHDPPGSHAAARCGSISIHVPREGHDVAVLSAPPDQEHFYPRAPGGARQRIHHIINAAIHISIHVPREGHDIAGIMSEGYTITFLSTCPGRGTTWFVNNGERLCEISIHVPREGHDLQSKCDTIYKEEFLSTCPGRGTTARFLHSRGALLLFLSTCPGRGTTGRENALCRLCRNFYPRAPGGARLDPECEPDSTGRFLSTCPGRGTTSFWVEGLTNVNISIHVPREGHDPTERYLQPNARYFYPRAPGGARRLPAAENGVQIEYFYPRAPGGARLGDFYISDLTCSFLSTCPGRGTTGLEPGGQAFLQYFYPRAPGGARLEPLHNNHRH